MRHAFVIVLTLATGAWAAAQQPPIFKSGVDIVELDVVVANGKGEPVRGLAQTDFAVREDGKPVTIESFAELDADGTANAADARFIVLLLDDWTAILNTTNVKRIARRFVDRMGPHDSIAILRVDSDAVASPMSHDQALAAIEKFSAAGPGLTTSAARTQHVFEMIGAVSRQMAPVAHRRKTLVFIGTPGYIARSEDRAPSRLTAQPSSGAVEPLSNDPPNTWFGADVQASRANVAVYVLDPAIKAPDPRNRIFYDRSSSGFATETGGEIFVGPNVFDRAVDEIWREAGHYYVIGYSMPATGRHASHRIDVKVGRSGANVRVRRTRAE